MVTLAGVVPVHTGARFERTHGERGGVGGCEWMWEGGRKA